MSVSRRRNYWKIVGIGSGFLAGLGLTAILLLGKDPDYGLALFVLMPVVVGAVTSSILAWSGVVRFRTLACYSFSSLGLIGATLFLSGGEGMICLLMALGVLLIPVLIGVAIGYAVAKSKDKDRNRPALVLAFILLLPPIAADELYQRHHSTQITYSSSVDIAASPEVVWQQIENLGTLPAANDWMSKLGLACPETAELKGKRVGAERVCTLSTGVMKETITAWEPSRRLSFVALETPPPMKELNPFSDPHPPHLTAKYFRILSGEFKLEQLNDRITRLTRTTSFEHRIRPAIYWTFWCDLAASYALRRVLDFIKLKSEAQPITKLAKL